MTREYDDQVNAFRCRRCGNEDADKIEPVIELIGTVPSGMIGHAKLAQYRNNGFRCLVCEPTLQS
jgi:hypothetical protein